MRKFVLCLALLGSINCASKMPASYNQQTKTLYVLTDVVNSIGTLQLAAENAVPQNILPLSTARRIVQFCVDANTTIGKAPNGWYVVVSKAYAGVKNQLTPDELTKFSPALSAFEIVLNSFGSN